MDPPHSESKPIPHNAFQGHCSISPRDLLVSHALMVLSPFLHPRCSQRPPVTAGPRMCSSLTWNTLPTVAAFLVSFTSMLPSQGASPGHLILNSSPFLTRLPSVLLSYQALVF